MRRCRSMRPGAAPGSRRCPRSTGPRAGVARRATAGRCPARTDRQAGRAARVRCASNAGVPSTSGLQAGARVGPYQLLRPLGAGGMAEVWLARRADGAFKREVALKLPTLGRLRADLEPALRARTRHPGEPRAPAHRAFVRCGSRSERLAVSRDGVRTGTAADGVVRCASARNTGSPRVVSAGARSSAIRA